MSRRTGEGILADGGDGACRACTEADCDGLPGFCCGADVCKGHTECNMYICKDIEAIVHGHDERDLRVPRSRRR